RPGDRQAGQRGRLRGEVRPRQLGARGLGGPLGPDRRNPPPRHDADRRPRAGSRCDALVRRRGPGLRGRQDIQRDADLRRGRVGPDRLSPALHHGPSEQDVDLHRHRRRRHGDRRDHRDRHAALPPTTRAPSASLTQRLFRHLRGSPAVFVTHELLRRETVEERAYQVNIARACLERSTLVVLPTGMGKTVIAAMVIAEVLRRRGGRILFLAPTKPLVEQHAASMRKVLVVDRITLFTGEATAPEDRELLWRENKIIVSTPQVIRNDVRAERISLDDVSLIVFDEAHRAVGDYAYVDVAAAYKEVPDRLVLGMTASPGSSAEKILEVCGNLGITAVEIRTEYDPDVVPYQHDLQIERIPVEAPDVSKEIRKLLQTVVDEQVARLKKLGFLAGRARVTRKDLLAVGNEARARLDSGVKDGRLYGAMTAQAIAMKADHAIELAETQGLGSLRLYFENMQKDTKTKADVQFLKHAKTQEAIQLAEATEVEHPKLAKTGWIVRKQLMEKADSKVIVFAHYRQTADRITQELARIPSVKPMRFVGQASRGEDIGLSQKEQVDILDKFRAGQVNVLVATSIGEEGLDIPQVDLVVFYEPVPSEIRTIQRRGRTGRSAAGRVVTLVTKDTRDEAYLYSARRKERKMHLELDRLRKDLKQKIFVGEPGGETFVAAAPEKRIETLRAQSHDRAPVPESRRRPSKKGQTTFEDY
ncbi:MAG: DEAD/DEAH box helicase, partial [Methanobacteriota archaeon]